MYSTLLQYLTVPSILLLRDYIVNHSNIPYFRLYRFNNKIQVLQNDSGWGYQDTFPSSNQNRRTYLKADSQVYSDIQWEWSDVRTQNRITEHPHVYIVLSWHVIWAGAASREHYIAETGTPGHSLTSGLLTCSCPDTDIRDGQCLMCDIRDGQCVMCDHWQGGNIQRSETDSYS